MSDNSNEKKTEKAKVDHTYTDYSHIQPDKGDLACIENETPESGTSEASCNFPVKLHKILSREDLSHIITWMPHGRSWKVLNRKEFTETVISQYFSHQKYSSFTRQVTGWGFKRITQGDDKNSYYHELFLRGMPHLTKRIKRPSSTSTSSKKLVPDPENEPDFYLISIDYPLPQTSGEEDESQTNDELPVLPSIMELDTNTEQEKQQSFQEQNDFFVPLDKDTMKSKSVTDNEATVSCSSLIKNPSTSSNPFLRPVQNRFGQQHLKTLSHYQQSLAILNVNQEPVSQVPDLSNELNAQRAFKNEKSLSQSRSLFCNLNAVKPFIPNDVGAIRFGSQFEVGTQVETTNDEAESRDLQSEQKEIRGFLNSLFRNDDSSILNTNQLATENMQGLPYDVTSSNDKNQSLNAEINESIIQTFSGKMDLTPDDNSSKSSS